MTNIVSIKAGRGDVEWVHQCGCGCQKFYLEAGEPGSVSGRISCAKCGETQPTQWNHEFVERPK